MNKMNKIITIILSLFFITSVFASKLYVGGEKYEKEKVIALTKKNGIVLCQG